jgi:hypothetical protein
MRSPVSRWRIRRTSSYSAVRRTLEPPDRPRPNCRFAPDLNAQNDAPERSTRPEPTRTERHICGARRTERRFCSRLSGRVARRSVRLQVDHTALADHRFDEFAKLAGVGHGRSARLSSAPYRRVISCLPATLHDEIREQIDRPSTLVTDWLNLHTPVGREYVGHRRVDHEGRVCPRSTVRVQLTETGTYRRLRAGG